MHIGRILLLEADVETIQKNLQKRDKKEYATSDLVALQKAERECAYSIAAQLPCKLAVHTMTFTDTDVEACLNLLD
mgnify:FL=1